MEPRVPLPLPPCEWVSRYDATSSSFFFLSLFVPFPSVFPIRDRSPTRNVVKRIRFQYLPTIVTIFLAAIFYAYDSSLCLCFLFLSNQPRFASTERIYRFSERAIKDRYLYGRDVKGYFSRETRDEDFVLIRYSTLSWQNILILACFGKVSVRFRCYVSKRNRNRFFGTIFRFRTDAFRDAEPIEKRTDVVPLYFSSAKSIKSFRNSAKVRMRNREQIGTPDKEKNGEIL